jgi:hypothetical protein
VTELLAVEMGGEPATSETLAAAAGRLLDTLCQRLADVIGPAGVQSIFLRAVKLGKSEFAFLDERIVPAESRDSLAEPLRAALQEREPDVIRKVSVTLFATFLGLLANVIGDRLTWSLLQQSWPDTLLPRTNRQETDE